MARSELTRNLKFRRLQLRLGIPIPYLVGLLECMWHVGYESGSDLLGSDDDVELAAQWPGTRGDLVKALASERFIEKKGKNWHIHDLGEHAPEYVKKKMKRKQEQRLSNDKCLHQETADTGRQVSDNVGQEPVNGHQTAENVCSINPTYPTHITQHTQPKEKKIARAEGSESEEEKTTQKEIKIPTCDHPHFRAAWEAFDRWSFRAPPVGRGSGLSDFANEHTKIAELLIVLDQCPPIVRANRESVPQSALAAVAIDGLAAEGTEFRGIKYAIACVRGRLGDWARDGEPRGKKNSVDPSSTWDRQFTDGAIK